MRLIDADALLKGRQDHTYISTHEIWNAPTVDPIKHGRWVRHTVHRADGSWYYSGVECSVCRNQENGRMRKYSYCPNCGAKMDEVKE